MKEGRSPFRVLTRNLTGNRPSGGPRRRWEDNIIMNLKELGINRRNWVDLAQDRNYCTALANAALNLRIA